MTPRILFLAEAVTATHVVRPHVLASALAARGDVEAIVACDQRAWSQIGTQVPYKRVHLESLAPSAFRTALAAGRPFYDAASAQASVEADLRLLSALKPDLVVSDFRISAGIAARLTGTRHATISNHWWHSTPVQEYPVPELHAASPLMQALTRTRWASTSLVRGWITEGFLRPFNRIRRRFGQPPVRSLGELYQSADAILYENARELAPSLEWPAHHHWLGPVRWAPAVDQPKWWNRLSARPSVYVTFGSSGGVHHLGEVLTGLQQLDVDIMVSTSNRIAESALPPGVMAAPQLNGRAAAERASLVVCHGGAGPVHQALASGRPVLAVPSNLDQFLSAESLEATGAGKMIAPKELSAPRVAAEASALLDSPHHRQAARQAQEVLSQYDAKAIFNDLVDDLLAKSAHCAA